MRQQSCSKLTGKEYLHTKSAVTLSKYEQSSRDFQRLLEAVTVIIKSVGDCQR